MSDPRLLNIQKTSDRIPASYRSEKTIEDIKNDLNSLNWDDVTNQHLFNLRAVIFPQPKTVTGIRMVGKKQTGDLEIDHPSHSYYANGVPTHNTVNLPADYPYDDFDKLFRDAWKSGVRGITTYREGTMTAVLETNKKKDKETKKAKEELKDFYEEWEGHEDGRVRIDDVQLPSEYPMTGFKIVSEGRKWYISVAFKDKKMTKPFGIFVTTNHRENDVKTYSALSAMEQLATEAGILERIIEDNRKKYAGQTNINKLARTISLLLRHNVDIALIVKTLDALDDIPVFSFIYRIKKFLTKYITEMENGMSCPECGETLIYTEGCIKCSQCAYSKC